MRCRTIYFLSLCTLMAMPALGQVVEQGDDSHDRMHIRRREEHVGGLSATGRRWQEELPKGKIWGPGDGADVFADPGRCIVGKHWRRARMPCT